MAGSPRDSPYDAPGHKSSLTNLDCFCSRLQSLEEELSRHPQAFYDVVVLFPCDRP
ncbi:hypothetical protein YSA_00883 [Pseudomonas putida ND6]|uniref:Uncharacterized protein n=1 Tax=Pseudomonas putida ND6 TaxID=231023 RepID=I3UP32_PSEPU|nr:hypothetical protein YSA_00883 [Pseudomonas putida ND6]